MALLVALTGSSDVTAVTSTAATSGRTMLAGVVYAFVSSTDCFIAQGATPTATAADGSMFVPSRTVVYLAGDNGAALSVIRDTADGKASLTPVQVA